MTSRLEQIFVELVFLENRKSGSNNLGSNAGDFSLLDTC